MGETNQNGLAAVGAHKILRLLAALRRSSVGCAIYDQVEQMLDDLVDGQRAAEYAYVAIINQLLEACLGHLRGDSSLAIQLRLLQARLQPPLSETELAVLRDYVDRYAGHIDALSAVDSELFREAVQPLLDAFAIEAKAAGPAVAPESEPQEGEAASSEAVTESVPPAAALPLPEVEQTGKEQEAQAGDEQGAEAVEGAPEPEPEAGGAPQTADEETPAVAGQEAAAVEGAGEPAKLDHAYRSHLDSKRRDIQKLQATLAQQVLGTIAQNEEFGVLLEVVLAELRHASDARELEDLRWTLIREIEKLTRGHHDLAEKLDSTHHYLQLIESDSRRLSDELTRVRLLSLTDELTGLPNRRAFLRRIEDEVARVQRYGFPLSLALIDLDHFKQVNDKYGHGGGDEVLKTYAKDILSIFRHHDLVARYGGEEFAVLLPNTDAEGSMRALNKVRNRAMETRWKFGDSMIPVPTFSAGVSLYKPGETATAFIERADKALYEAKRLGRNRVEIDASYQGEKSTPKGKDQRATGQREGGRQSQ
ncbi:MAG TPA: diguanylate cyclase [Gammaproteobacteria bacterium]|nr:diguanylate cyclase [Gammaproteobacteria bacterium]